MCTNIPSALRPVFHDDCMPVTEQPDTYNLDFETTSEEVSPDENASMQEFEDIYLPSCLGLNRIHQAELNDLLCELDLPKIKTQFLGSWVHQSNLLQKDVKNSCYRKRQWRFSKYFSMDSDLVFSNDIQGLLEMIHVQYKPEQGRLFIYSYMIR